MEAMVYDSALDGSDMRVVTRFDLDHSRGLGRIHTRDLVATTALDPLSSYAGGAMGFDNLSGKDTAREDLYRADDRRTLGKANGRGEAVASAPGDSFFAPDAEGGWGGGGVGQVRVAVG